MRSTSTPDAVAQTRLALLATALHLSRGRRGETRHASLATTLRLLQVTVGEHWPPIAHFPGTVDLAVGF